MPCLADRKLSSRENTGIIISKNEQPRKEAYCSKNAIRQKLEAEHGERVFVPFLNKKRLLMEDKEYGSTHTLKNVRRRTGLKQAFFGMILGMSKDAVSRIENGHRRETAIHTELVSLVAFLFEMGLLEKYVQWRFRLNAPTLKSYKLKI